MKGWLIKKGRIKKWKSCWCVLEGAIFSYYLDENQTELLGQADLSTFTAVSTANIDDGYGFAVLHPSNTPHEFLAKDEHDRTAWLSAFSTAGIAVKYDDIDVGPAITSSEHPVQELVQDNSSIIAFAVAMHAYHDTRQQLLKTVAVTRQSTVRSCVLRWAHCRKVREAERLDAAVSRSTQVHNGNGVVCFLSDRSYHNCWNAMHSCKDGIKKANT